MFVFFFPISVIFISESDDFNDDVRSILRRSKGDRRGWVKI